MNNILKQKIKKYLELYSDTVIIDEGKAKPTVEYNCNIKVEGGIKFEDEAYVRAYLVAKLIHEYKYPMKNITLEKMYENTMGSNIKNKRTAFLDILVEDDDGNPFMMIECKTPDKFETDMHKIETQLFEPAHYAKRERKVSYLVYYSLLENQLQDRCIIIDFDKQSNYKEWIKSRCSYNKIPYNYGKVINALYANVKEECSIGKPLDASYTLADFSKLRTKLHNYLWGGGSSNYNDIFYYLTHMLLAKIWDERKRKKDEYYEFQIHYVDDEQEAYQETFERIEKLYKEAQSANFG